MIANQVKIPDPEERPNRIQILLKATKNQFLPMLPTTAMMAKNRRSKTCRKPNNQFHYPNAYAANHSDDGEEPALN
jgi:hypothetical protein